MFHQRNLRVSPTNNSLSSISSSTQSYSSSSSSSSSSSPLPSQVTMEEVWKEINLASTTHRHGQHPHHNHEPRFKNHQNPNSIFQDFLNIPTSLAMGSASSNGDSSNTVTALYTSPLPPPATVLSLTSGAGFEFLDNQDPLHHLANVTLVTSGCFGKKRGQEDSNEGSGNRRQKRMIKNRESAARSRARKQAYTNELQLEVAHLQAENARLKRQEDQLRKDATNPQPKKKTLQRTSTAPF